MNLNGKAKEKFLEWLSKTYDLIHYDTELWFKNEKEITQNALIIEFFDEIGIHINIFYKYTWRIEIIDFRGNLLSDLDFADFETRQEATIQAIKKANEIYNVRYSEQKQAK